MLPEPVNAQRRADEISTVHAAHSFFSENNLWAWQNLQPTMGGNSLFYQFCDALEVEGGISAGPMGWVLSNALDAWAKYWNSTYYT